MDWIYSKGSGPAPLRVGPADDPKGSYVPIAIPRKYQDLIPQGNEDFVVHRIYSHPVHLPRACQLRARTLDDPNRSFLAVGSSPEHQDCTGKRIAYEHFVMDRIIPDIMHRAG